MKMEEETLNTIKKPLDAIERLFTFLAMISVLMMACLTAADAMGRYFLNQPISGAFEVTENYLMIFAVYFAFAFAYKNGANVRITFVVSRLPSKATMVVHYCVQIFSIFYLVFLFISATQINLGRLNDVVEFTQTFSMPVWPAYLIISVGLVFVSLFVILDVWQVKRGKSGLFKDSSQETSSM
jgi:TRAP-type C4-dicarboxylate transport system permease small subunit